MKKFKMKVVVQSKETATDSPVTNQFSSGVYEDVSEVIPDLMSFLKDIQKNNVQLDSFDYVSPDIPAFELPHFDRLGSNPTVQSVIDIDNDANDPGIQSDTSIINDTDTNQIEEEESISKVESIPVENTTNTESEGFVVPEDEDEFDPDEDTNFDF